MIRSRYCVSRNKLKCWLLGAVLPFTGPAFAFDLADNVQAHGFVSQALSRSSDNKVGGDSDSGVATDLRELGANLSWRMTPDWLVSGQVLARWAGNSDDGDLRLDYGQVDRTLIGDADTSLGIRLGKIKNPYGFYNSTRDVAHTRPGIIMPQSIYLDRVRNFFLATPGIALYGDHAGERLDLAWNLAAIRPDGDDPDLESLLLGRQWPGTIEGKNSWLGQVMAGVDGGRWRLGLSFGEVNMQFESTNTALIGSGESRLRPLALSLERNFEDFSFTAEYAEIRNQGQGYGSGPGVNLLNDTNTNMAWYVQGTWRPATNWRVYVRRDEIYLDKNDKDGKKGSANTGSTIPAPAFFAKDWTLGVRHDIGAWLLAAEWHHVKGTVWLSPLDLPLASQKEDWDLLLLQAAWRF